MKKNKQLIQLKHLLKDKIEYIYIIALTIYIASLIFSNKTDFTIGFEKYLSLLRYMILFIIGIKIIVFDFEEYSKKTLINISILTVIIAIVTLKTDSRLLMQYFILILGAYKVSFEKIVKWVLITQSTLVLGIILLSLLKIIPNYAFTRSNNGTVRYSLGFTFSSYPAIFIYYLTMLYLYYRKNKLKIVEYIALIILNVIIYIFTDTKAELICAISLIVIVFLYNKIQKEWINKILIALTKYMMSFLTIFSIGLAFLYDSSNNIMSKTNDLLSDRLELSKKGMEEFGIKFFGNKIKWISLLMVYAGESSKNKFNYVDNGYLNIIYNYGIIIMLLILYGFYKVIEQQVKNKNTYICCFILMLAVHTFITPQLLQVVYNIFLLLLVDVIIQPKKQENDKKEII